MGAERHRQRVVLLERALVAVSVICFAWYGLVSLEATYYEAEARAALHHRVAKARSSSDSADKAWEARAPERLIGLLEIPRLRMSTPVLEGDDGGTLRLGAGHLPDTPRPWEAGNSAIAAHRDGRFRPLKDIRVGDDVRILTPRGEIQYLVRRTRIVTPTDLSVLAPTDRQMLTLITCYPFYYVGNAPKRFVVHAERVSPVAYP